MGSLRILKKPAAQSFIGMGAIIIILSITMDPFVQLTVGKKDELKFENNTFVMIPYAQRYNRELFIGERNITYARNADLIMKSAVLEGLTQSDLQISQQLRPSCQSGNCTWDAFTSLAICSGCNNLTDQIRKKHKGIWGLWYTLPNGLEIPGDGYNPMTAFGTKNSSRSLSFASLDTLVWSMTMMRFTANEASRINDSVFAIECGLWYCVNSYQSMVRNGRLTETIQPAPSEKQPDSWQPIDEHDNSSVISVPLSFFSLSPAFRDAVSPNDITSPRRTDLQLGEGFNISQGAAYSISYVMSDILNAINSRNRPTGTVERSNSSSSSDGKIYNPPAMEYLCNSQDLEATFASLAKSMTNNFRQNSENHTVVNGKEGNYIVLIRIRGWYLTLPVILIVGGVVFVAVVLHYTHTSKMKFWATNALPIIALGGEMGQFFDDHDMRINTMKQNAKRQLIQFPTLQPRQNFDQADMWNRNENHEIMSLSRSSVIESTLADVENIVSPIRTSGNLIPPADIEEAVSPPSLTLVIQSPPAEVLNIVSPRRSSIIHSPSSDAENIVSPIRTSEIPILPAGMGDAVSIISNEA